MESKNILLFLFLFIVGTGMYGQERSTNNLLSTTNEPNAYLGSITWPDMPVAFKGDLAIVCGWKGDTIPSFDSIKMDYVLTIPETYQEIPALTFSTRHPNSKVVVTRAKSLWGPVADRTITFTVIAEDSSTTNVYSVLLRREQDPLDIEFYKSIVYSKMYKVSEGNGLNETIKGVTMGTTVAEFYANITKADELQTLKVIAAASGTELTEADVLSTGDTLLVLSADKSHTSKYILEVTAVGLSSISLLTSSIYTINVTGSTGTITGFPYYTLIKTVLEGVVIPSGATLTIVDQNDAYMPLVKLNYDTVYINTLATPNVYFEVISENGANKVLYRLIPTSHPSDAYVTSDFYNIDQYISLISFIPQGTSVSGLLSHVTPALGANMKVIDIGDVVRPSGIIDREDRLVVTSEDGTSTRAYYFRRPIYWVEPYLVYVLSDDYLINQVSRSINGVSPGTGIAVFKSKLYPSFGATMKVIDAQGNESTLATIVSGDQLMVTSADSLQTATYSIAIKTGVDPVEIASTISMFPNPTIGRVVVQGLAKGNRLRVLNATGIVLHDVMAGSSTQTVSLDAQPTGIYLFEVSAGTQPIKIHKIVKK